MRWKPMVAALALSAISPMASAAPAPRIATEKFAQLPVLKKPVLSPDGRRIAARSEFDGQTTVAILDADRPQSPARAISLARTRVHAMRWAGSDRLLLTVRASEKVAGGHDSHYLRLLAVDVTSGASRIVDGNSRGTYAGDVLYADPSGNWALVASQDDDQSYPSVKRVDLATGRAVQVEKARDGIWDWYADEHGVVRAGVAYEDRDWTVWYRDGAGDKLRRVRGKLDSDDDSAVDRFIFRGGKNWIVTNQRTGRFGLYAFDIESGAVGEKVFEHPTADLTEVYYDPASGEVNAVQYEDDRKRMVWLDPEFEQLQANLDRALPAAVNLPIDWSTDENRVLVWSEGASDPGRFFLLDRKSAQMHAVVDPYPAIDPALLADVRWVEYTARDGLRIPAYLTLPKGVPASKLPLILMPHGGPFERDHWSYDALVQFLANRGYAVLQPQFRGSTGRGKDFVARGYGEWGRKMQDDLDDGVDWLVGTGQVDPGRVCIVGSSYGGYAAMWAAIRNPDRYRCAASMAGVSDLPKMIRYDRKLFSATRYFKEWRSRVAGSEEIDLRAVSPIHFASRLKIPIFIAHGEKDQNVPPDQSRAMVAALAAAKGNVTSVFYPDASHGFDRNEDLHDWLARLEAFLGRHNPA